MLPITQIQNPLDNKKTKFSKCPNLQSVQIYKIFLSYKMSKFTKCSKLQNNYIKILFGVEKLRFKPAYNPYTEPSMEIFSYHEGLGKWVEIGNSGTKSLKWI